MRLLSPILLSAWGLNFPLALVARQAEAEPTPSDASATSTPSDASATSTPSDASATSTREPAVSEAPPELEEFEATAAVSAPPREPTKRSVAREEISKIPGTGGDALRAIEVLPGVARTSINDGTPILRGASGSQSQTLLDGIPVPFLYHFGGVKSFVSSRMLDRVELFPGNFSSRFGRASGGIIDVRMRDPDPDHAHAALDLNLIDGAVFAETPIGSKAGLSLAARRSFVDVVFKEFVPKDAYSVVAAPVYYDYQALGTYRFDARNRLRVLGYGSRDALAFVFARPNADDPGLTGAVNNVTAFHRAQVELHSDLSATVTQDLSVAFGRIDIEQRFGELAQNVGGEELHGRGEWSAEIDPALRLSVGGDFFGSFLSGTYHGPAVNGSEGDPHQRDPIAAGRLISLSVPSFNVVQPGAFIEFSYRPSARLLLVPGVRADYYREIRGWSVDPRLSARWELSRATTLKWGVGRYSQPPQYWQSIPGLGNPRIKPYFALQTSAGVEQRVAWLKLDVEGFYQRLSERAVTTEGGVAPYFVNDGDGRIYGAEFSVEARPDPHTFAFVAYTLSRSERRDHNGPFRLFDQDQTHILSLTLSRKLGRGWEVGARFRLTSGNPTTPIVGNVFDARSGVYRAEYGAVNSERNPTFHELDLRVEKAFHIGELTLAAYFDVQNAYNAKNPEGFSYSYDYRKRSEAAGMPLFPNLGLRAEL